MGARRRIRKRRSEMGIALLIAIFILLLIGVVAIALIVSSGTETALAGNYRSSTGVYYAAVAGLEEARARLRTNNPNAFTKTDPSFLPPSGTPLGVCSPIYLLNPLGGETIAPWDPANAYYDSEFNNEFAGVPNCTLPSPSPSTPSLWNTSPLNGLPFPSPFYKWVRINGVSEQSLNLDVFPYGGNIDPTLVYYDGTKLNDRFWGNQVLEITALAVLPNGSQQPTQKLVQYMVAPIPPVFPNFSGMLTFPAALTIAGNDDNGVTFSAPTSNNSYFASGVDLAGLPGCTAGPPVHAVGVFDAPDVSNVSNGGNGGSGIPVSMQSKYTGYTTPVPDVVNVMSLLSSNLQNPSQIDAVAKTIMLNADATIPSGPVTYPLPTISGSSLSAATTGMSSTNPMTVVVNGNLDLTNWHNTGYGMLLVTGNLNYDPDASWQGMILVIGQGTVTGSKGGNGEIDGEVFVAKTRDASGNLLSGLGKTSVIFGSNMGGNGIRYSSCWVQRAQPASNIKILSFHEIAQ